MLVLVGAALFLLVVGALVPRWPRGGYAFVTACAAGAAAVLSMVLWDDATDEGPSTLVGDALAFDTFAMFVTITICAGLLLLALVFDDYLRREDLDGPELYALMLVAATGGIVMGAANDLIVLFVGLETLSLAFYVLSPSYRRKTGSSESGLKYFVLGGFSSAFFLYGIALVYGAVGSTNITDMVATFERHLPSTATTPWSWPARPCCSSGWGSRSPPCRSTCGRPTCTRARRRRSPRSMASVGKVAAFAALMRVVVVALPFYRDDWRPVDLGTGVAVDGRRRRSSPSCRPTSSGCSPTRRSTTPASSSSASRPPRTGPGRSTAASACRARWSTSWPTPCSSSARSPSSPLVAGPR